MYDGATADVLATDLSLPRVIVLDEVASTMDVATAAGADGAPAGTLVIADMQRAGRGRGGRHWESSAGDGLWMTLLERVNDAMALEVLSLRIGLRAARALDRFAPAPIRLKWPNDLLLPDGKLGGILLETRWHGDRPEWTAIGIGINIRHVGYPGGAALGPAVSRREVLADLVPAIRAAANARGHLSDQELADFASRDASTGRMCREPLSGRVAGIGVDGALIIDTSSGPRRVREGSLVFDGASPSGSAG